MNFLKPKKFNPSSTRNKPSRQFKRKIEESPKDVRGYILSYTGKAYDRLSPLEMALTDKYVQFLQIEKPSLFINKSFLSRETEDKKIDKIKEKLASRKYMRVLIYLAHGVPENNITPYLQNVWNGKRLNGTERFTSRDRNYVLERYGLSEDKIRSAHHAIHTNNEKEMYQDILGLKKSSRQR